MKLIKVEDMNDEQEYEIASLLADKTAEVAFYANRQGYDANDIMREFAFVLSIVSQEINFNSPKKGE